MWYSSSSGRIELQITRKQAATGYHSGACDLDIEELSKLPAIARQLRKINPQTLREELREWGTWSDEELSDHEQNLQRILWLACGDIVEAAYQ